MIRNYILLCLFVFGFIWVVYDWVKFKGDSSTTKKYKALYKEHKILELVILLYLIYHFTEKIFL